MLKSVVQPFVLAVSLFCCLSLTQAKRPREIPFTEVLQHLDPKKKVSQLKFNFFNSHSSIDLSKYVDPLPRLPRLIVGNRNQIQVTLGQVRTRFYRDLPETLAWGYDGITPGPTIEVESGHPVRVFWKNDLPSPHVIASDDGPGPGMPAPAPGHEIPDVRAVTHLHGAVVSETNPMDRVYNNDGWPDAWNVRGQTQIADYPNPESSRLLWYHDHAMGATARNVYAGLAGMYIIRDSFERSLNLPKDEYEIPMILQTKGFNNDGSLYYPRKITSEVYGSAITVNGKVWPFQNVEPRRYRLRLLNGANARSFTLRLIDANDESLGPVFYQIGSDGGFLQNTLAIRDLILAPAERADVIVDFSQSAGKTFLLQNNAVSDDGDAQLYLPEVMIFKVGTQLSNTDSSSLPNTLRAIPKFDLKQVAQTRKIVLTQKNMPGMAPMMMLNDKMWEDPTEEKPVLGTTEIWELINTLPDYHPFHLHLVQFQVIDRRPLNSVIAVLPDENERGWKDTVRLPPKSVTRIVMRFGPFTGHYVYHCHILEHEDMGMMRPFDVVAH